MGVQELLDNPNNADAAQENAYRLFKKSTVDYGKRVRIEAAKYTELPGGGGGGGGGYAVGGSSAAGSGAANDEVILL